MTETAIVAFERVVQPLEPAKASIVRESFGAMFSALETWQEEAQSLTVTAADQTGKMKRARLLRLEIKEKRVELDKRRKAMKEGIVREGRAIDGAFAVFTGMSEPLELWLKEQETFADRQRAAEVSALHEARKTALLALGVAEVALPAALGEMSAEAWALVLDDAQRAKRDREQAAADEEAARVEAARILAERRAAEEKARIEAEAARKVREEEQRAENARLKAEAEERERVAAEERRAREEEKRAEAERLSEEAKERQRIAREEQAARDAEQAREAAERDRERAAVEKERAAERAAAAAEKAKVETEARRRVEAALTERQAAEREAAQLRAAEQARIAKEAEAKKPTKAKYALLIKALRDILATPTNDFDSYIGVVGSIATDALTAVGEGGEPHAD